MENVKCNGCIVFVCDTACCQVCCAVEPKPVWVFVCFQSSIALYFKLTIHVFICPMTNGGITASWELLICREGTAEADRPLERGMAGEGVV